MGLLKQPQIIIIIIVDLIGSTYGPVAGFYEHDSETSASVERHRISWPTEQLLACKEGPFSIILTECGTLA
jgi:hypothetical protein